MSAAREEYEDKIVTRNKQATEESKPAAEAAPSGFKQAAQSAGAQQASAGAQQGDVLSTVGGAAMMSGNPYAMAAGLGLTVLAAGEKNKRAQEEAQRQAYNERIARRQQVMQQIASQGIQ